MDDYRETVPILRAKLKEFLLQMGADVSAGKRNNFSCLLHEDKKPSMHFYEHSNTCHCFSCGFHGDIFDLVGELEKLSDFPSKYRKVKEYFPLDNSLSMAANRASSRQITDKKAVREVLPQRTVKDFTKLFSFCHQQINKTDYARKRGFSDATIKKAGLGFNSSFFAGGNEKWEALIIPTSKFSFVARNINPQNFGDRYQKRGASVLYSRFANLSTGNPLIITEGEFDALSIVEIGGEALALGSVSNKNKLLPFLNESGNKDKNIILCLDNDSAGTETTNELEKQLSGNGYKVAVWKINSQYKDLNDYLVSDRHGLEREFADFSQSVKRNFITPREARTEAAECDDEEEIGR